MSDYEVRDASWLKYGLIGAFVCGILGLLITAGTRPLMEDLPGVIQWFLEFQNRLAESIANMIWPLVRFIFVAFFFGCIIVYAVPGFFIGLGWYALINKVIPSLINRK